MKNSFLGKFPSIIQAPLVRELLPHGYIIATPGQDVKHVVFPLEGVISTILQTIDGQTIEVGHAGSEGFAPANIAFRSPTARHLSVVQLPGEFIFMPAKTFVAAMDADARIRDAVLRFAEYSFGASVQFAACNAVHSAMARYACRLLMLAARVGYESIPITQELIAQILGVRRATITVIAHDFSARGTLRYHRGMLTIVDPVALEAASCECYRRLEGLASELLGVSPVRPTGEADKGIA